MANKSRDASRNPDGYEPLAGINPFDQSTMITGSLLATSLTFGNCISIDLATGAVTRLPGFTTTDAAALAFWEAVERLAPKRDEPKPPNDLANYKPTRNPDGLVQLPTRHQVWKDGKWIDVCDCNVPRDQCEHPVCTHGIINAARDANQ